MPKVRDLQDGGSAQMDADKGVIESHVRFAENGEKGEVFRFFVLGEVSPIVVASESEFHVPFSILGSFEDTRGRPHLPTDTIQNRRRGELPSPARVSDGRGGIEPNEVRIPLEHKLSRSITDHGPLYRVIFRVKHPSQFGAG